jgi:putative two-component system response regulator
MRLARAAEYRDDNTWEHTQRVGAMAARLGRGVGLDDHEVDLIRAAAPVHDLGKIAIPDTILLKPDRLTEEEFEVVKTHAALGARILEESAAPLFRTAERICRSHHERWDGSGYPDGLTGEDIPLAGRLVAVADVFDILVHERPYKEGMSVADAAAELRRNAGTQFDPAVVDAFDELGAATWQALASEI